MENDKIELNPQQKKWAKILGVLAGLGLGYLLLPVAIAFVNGLVTLTIGIATLAAVCGGLAAAWFVVASEQFRGFMKRSYLRMWRAIEDKEIQQDPIGTLKAIRDQLYERVQKIYKVMNSLLAEAKALKAEMENNVKEMKAAFEDAQAVKKLLEKERDPEEKQRLMYRYENEMKKAQRRQSSNDGLKVPYMNIERWARSYKMYHVKGCARLEDTDDQIKNKESEFRAMSRVKSTMSDVRDMFDPHSKEADMFQRTLQHIQDECNQTIGEMDTFMEMSADVWSEMDMKEAMKTEKAEMLFNQFVNDPNSILLSLDEKKQIADQASDEEDVFDPNEQLSPPVANRLGNSSLDDLLNKN